MGKVKAKSASKHKLSSHQLARKARDKTLEFLSRPLKDSIREIVLLKDHEYALGQVDMIRDLINYMGKRTNTSYKLELSIRLRER